VILVSHLSPRYGLPNLLIRFTGPRLMSYALGYGPDVWRAGNYYFWIPMVAPFFGCLFGGWLYDMFLFTGKSFVLVMPR
jgi:aquaglyceroporin related protein